MYGGVLAEVTKWSKLKALSMEKYEGGISPLICSDSEGDFGTSAFFEIVHGCDFGTILSDDFLISDGWGIAVLPLVVHGSGTRFGISHAPFVKKGENGTGLVDGK